MKKAILYTGGSINFILAIFHMFFWKMLNWPEELKCISIDNRGIIQIANIILIFIILYFGVMMFVMVRRAKIDIYAKSILVCISVFYLIRLIGGYIFFGFSYSELIISLICILIIITCLYVILTVKNEQGSK